MYGTDATDSCEELDVIQAAGNYGWPDVGPFPFSDCYFGDQVKAIHLFTRPDKTPGQFQSFVRVSGLEFVTAARYTALGDALLTCEAETSEMRRVVVSGNQVTSDDKVLGDCDGDITTSGDGTIYYSNATEIRRLLPGQTGG